MTSRPTAIGMHIYSGAWSLGFMEKFDILGQWEELDAGMATFKLNLGERIPHVFSPQGPSGWPIAENTGRVNLVYANPPCFLPSTRVLTESGWRQIGHLVNRKSIERVVTISDEGSLELKPITGWHKNPYNGTIYRVRMKHGGRAGRAGSPKAALATHNHQFFTKRGWIPAAELLIGDMVATGELSPNLKQMALIDGMMLGDATIKKHQDQFVCDQTSEELIGMKATALQDFVCGTGVNEGGLAGDGYVRKSQYGFYSKTMIWTKQQRARWYREDGKKIVPRDLALDDLTLAVWFMDDGSGRNLHWSERSEYESLRKGARISLATCGFEREDIDFLVDLLKREGISAEAAVRKSGYVDISIAPEGAEVFFRRIGKYVPSSFRYKLPSEAPDFDPLLWELGDPVVGWDLIYAEPYQESSRTGVYCIDVEGNHNFVTHGGVAHNCAVWSTTGSLLGENDPRVEYTKNCARVAQRLQPDFFVMESVCRAWSPNGGRNVYTQMALEFGRLGYATTIWLSNTLLHGAAQFRERFHFIAHRYALDIREPRFTLEDVKTVRMTIEDLEDSAVSLQSGMIPSMPNHVYPILSLGERNVIKHLGQGEGWNQGIERCKEAKESWKAARFLAGRLHYDLPSQTLVDIACVIHPTKTRLITLREGARLCGYPDWYVFASDERNRTYQARAADLTQAALPWMGRFLGGEFTRALDVAEEIESPTLRPEDIRVIDFRPIARPFRPKEILRGLEEAS